MGDLFGISAGASALGSGTTAAAGAFYGNKIANENTSDAQNFAAWMAAHQYSRTVKDLKRAGLNPMLAYMGSVSPSPNVSAAQTVVPDVDFDIGKAVSSALAVRQAKDNIKITEHAASRTEAEAKEAWYNANAAQYKEAQQLQTLLNLTQQRDLTNAETERTRAMRENIDADTSWIRARDYSTRVGTPYSPEQIELIKRGPVGEGSREIKRAVEGFLSTGRQVRDTLGRHERGE